MSRKSLSGGCGFVGLVVMLVSPVVVMAGDSFELRPKFPAGRVRYIEVDADIQQTMKTPGGEMNIKITQLTGILEKVESASKDEMKTVLTFDRRAMGLEHPMMGNLQYDSDMPNEDEAPYLKQIFAPLIGMSMTLTLDKSAHVTSFTGMDAILKKAEASARANPFFAQMRAEFTNESAKATWGDSRWAVLPEKRIKVGDTWKNRIENDIPQLGKLISDFDCKLDRIAESDGRKVAIISYAGKISQPPDEEKTQKGAVGIRLRVKEGTFKGTARFDLQSGEIVEQVRETQLKMTMQSPGGEGAPSMEMMTTSKETTVVKSPTQREKEKKENLKKARAKEAEAKKAKADSKEKP